MSFYHDMAPTVVLHWNYRGFTEFPLKQLQGEESDITDIYLKENLISRVPSDIGRLENLESLYLSGNDIRELPREIAKLRNLKCLDVSGNRLKCLPDEIGKVRRLKFLILDENELCELPLRISELQALRYLSVCDNNLKWLPQRPVYNYHHCEFRFWRNRKLKTIPYSLWYHMFRDQQTRSLNIGCLYIPNSQDLSKRARCRLKLDQDSREWEVDVSYPQQYTNILENINNIPPSLYELCKRKFYQMLCEVCNNITNNNQNMNYCSETIINNQSNSNKEITDIQTPFNQLKINNENSIACDINGNNCELQLIPSVIKRESCKGIKTKKDKECYYVVADIVEENFSYLPTFIKSDLNNGPASRCENVSCKRPIFDYATYEFTFGKIILIDNTEDVILSAMFCSKVCADVWKRGKTNLIPWHLVK